MKKILTLIAVSVISVGLVLAQGAGPAGGFKPGQAGGPGGPGGGRMGGMRKMNEEIMAKLGLNADQKKKIAALEASNKKAMEARRAKMKASGAKPDRTAMMAEMKKMRDANKAALAKILTPAQMKKYEALVKEARAKMMKERGANGGAGAAAGARGGKGKKGGV